MTVVDGPMGLERVDHGAREGVDAVEGGRDGGEQHGGIVVALVERSPTPHGGRPVATHCASSVVLP